MKIQEGKDRTNACTIYYWPFPDRVNATFFPGSKKGAKSSCFIIQKKMSTVMIRESYPLLRIDKCIDELGVATIFRHYGGISNTSKEKLPKNHSIRHLLSTATLIFALISWTIYWKSFKRHFKTSGSPTCKWAVSDCHNNVDNVKLF